MKYRAIGFDYGGVIKGQPGYLFDQKLSKLLGISVEKYRSTYFKHNKKMIDTQDMWELILRDLSLENKQTEVERFLLDMRASKKINQAIISLIDDLRDSGYITCLFSNNSKQKAQIMRQEGIDTHFDVFCVSTEVGVAKPNPRAFQLLAEGAGVSLNQLVFIDDEVESLKTAEECGYTPILYRSYEQLVNELRKLDISLSSNNR